MEQTVFHQRKKVMISKRPKSPVALWLRIITFLILISDFFSYFIYGQKYVGKGSLLGWLIAFFCGNECAKWAAQIKKSPNWAYVIGFMFSVPGLLAYYIYYKKKLKIRKRRKSRRRR